MACNREDNINYQLVQFLLLNRLGLNSFECKDNLEEDSDIINEAEDTMTILRKYLTSMSANTDIKDRVEKIVTDLYTKAQTIE